MRRATETPITDARVFHILSDLQSGTREVVDAEVARDLERRLNALTAHAADCNSQHGLKCDCVNSGGRES